MLNNIPNRLRIVDGELVMADGSDVRAYLREFAKARGLQPDHAVNLVGHDSLVSINKKAYAYDCERFAMAA